MSFLPGTEVEARGLRWEVVEAIPVGSQTRVRLRGVGGVFTGREVDLLHPFEPVAPISRELSLDKPTTLPNWRVFLEAYLLEQSFGPDAFVAVQPGRLRIEPYQLVPVARALRMSRPRLLLGDDTGLGKTIEAGLIIAELIARRRVHRVLVVSPAGPLLEQWRQEMAERFGLRLAVVDRAALDHVRQGTELGTNPWDYLPLAIASQDFLKQDNVLSDLERTNYDLVVVDECHHYFGGDVASEEWSDDTQRRKLGEVLARISDALLLASATPHDGRDRSLGSLLELLDPSLVDGRGLPRGQAFHEHMVRRLKSHVVFYNPKTGKREPFKERQVIPVPVQVHADPKSATHALHWALLELVGPELKSALRRREYAEALTFTSLLKRSTSTVQALLNTLNAVRTRFAELVDKAEEETESRKSRLKTMRALKRKLDRYGTLTLDEEREFTALEVEDLAQQLFLIERSDRTAKRDTKRARTMTEILEQLAALAEHALAEDPKLDALVAKLREIRAKEPKTNVLVYTEYVDSLKALAVRLGAEGIRHLTIHGEDDDATRQERTNRFRTRDDLVLVSTDASAEGLNMHQRCHHLIHLELPWSPIRIEQRNGRIDRYGQFETPMVRYLYLVGTFEERILARLVAKHEHQRKALKFVPDTLGEAGGGLPESIYLQALASEQGRLFATRKPFDFESDDKPEDDDVQALLDEIDKSLSRFISAAKTQTWFSSGVWSDLKAGEDAAQAMEQGRRSGEVDLLDFVRGAVLLEGGNATDRDGYVELRLPEAWRHELAELPGYDADHGVLRVTTDLDLMRDEKERSLGFLGRAHPIVRRAIERVRHLSLGQRDGTDARVAVARSSDGEDAVIVTLVGRVQSREGRELEHVLAVRLKKGKKPEVLKDSSWLPNVDDAVGIPKELWGTRFAPWAEDAESAALVAAKAYFTPVAASFRKEHLAILDRERDEMKQWIGTRAEDILGAPDIQSDLFKKSPDEIIKSVDPVERLSAFVAEEGRTSKKRVEAEAVLSSFRGRLNAIDARAALGEAEVLQVGLIMLLDTKGVGG